MEKLEIRKADGNELDQIEEIYNETIDWLDSKGIHQWKRGVYPTRSSAESAYRENTLFCCHTGGRLAATLILNEIQPSQYQTLSWKYEASKILVVHTLIVRPTETGKGFARSIMEFVLDYARRNGYECIRLDAFPDNAAAVSLYRSLGFEYAGDVFFEYKEPSYEWYSCFERCLI